VIVLDWDSGQIILCSAAASDRLIPTQPGSSSFVVVVGARGAEWRCGDFELGGAASALDFEWGFIVNKKSWAPLNLVTLFLVKSGFLDEISSICFLISIAK
jgi:hypothetical protein